MKNFYNIVFRKLFNPVDRKKYAAIGTTNAKPVSAYQTLIQQEMAALKTRFKHRLEPDPPEIIKQTTHEAIWRIQLAQKEYRYMTFNAPNCIDENHSIIYVDTEILYLALLKVALTPQAENWNEACCLRNDMPQHYQYPYAEQAFSLGIDNPVPLAVINCYLSGLNPMISFTEGDFTNLLVNC